MAGPSRCLGTTELEELLEKSDNSSITSGSSSDSDCDYTQQEIVPHEEEEENIETVNASVASVPVQWAWQDLNAPNQRRQIPFRGQQGPQ